MSTPRVALDAMGGDHAPDAAVDGALLARDEHGVDVVLVGPGEQLARALEERGARRLPIVAASQVVGMADDPVAGVRAKPSASVRVGARLIAAGEAAALVSAGSTGATLAAALLEIGRLPGVRRPAVAALLPVPAVAGGAVVLVDAGGNADAHPDALAAYARMGDAYARVRGVAAPRVGLLNVGTEPGKGNALARATYALLDGGERFIGNVEPDAVLAGGVDVLITDGFTGNVFLKALEAASHAFGATRVAADGERGAAVLVGIAGEVLVSHGAAGARQIAAALRTASAVAAGRLSRRIAERLA
jgi:phosphate acyltransferase